MLSIVVSGDSKLVFISSELQHFHFRFLCVVVPMPVRVTPTSLAIPSIPIQQILLVCYSHFRCIDSDNDNDVYFTLATSDSRIGKYKTENN